MSRACSRCSENSSSIWGEPSSGAINCLEPRGDLGDQDVGEAAAGLLGGVGRRDFGGQRVLMQPLDHGAEQRFLGFEMMVQRLPRQAGGLRRLFDRRTPKTLAAEHQHGGVEDAVAGLHLTILTKYDEMSNDGT